jgi:hypothetical protein
MPDPGGGHMGHSKHRKKGKSNKGGFTKLRMQMDFNQPKLRPAKPPMFSRVADIK